MLACAQVTGDMYRGLTLLLVDIGLFAGHLVGSVGIACDSIYLAAAIKFKSRCLRKAAYLLSSVGLAVNV